MNNTIVDGLIVRQFPRGDLSTIIHRDRFIAALQQLPVDAQGCIKLIHFKRTFPDKKKGYSHTKPVVSSKNVV